MGFKYAIRSDRLHFLTHTVANWIDLFTRRELAMIIVDSLNYCIEKKGLEVYAWCLMPSHLHMIATTSVGAKDNLSGVMRDFKKFTSKELVNRISLIAESRKEWLLRHFQMGNDSYQLWMEGMHPIELFTKRFTDQKVDYIHNNPVDAGIVFEPEQYVLISACDYYDNRRRGLVNICYI